MSTFLILVLTAAVVLDTAHNLSPIVMAWSHRGYRALALANPVRSLLIPGLAVTVAVVIGVVTSMGWTSYDLTRPHQIWRLTQLSNPFPILVWIYFFWNLYHFGAQNFGLLRLWRRATNRIAPRWLDQATGFGITIAGMVLLPYWIGWVMFSLSHWLTEIALTVWVSKQRVWFLLAVLTLGVVGFLWFVPPWQQPDNTLVNGSMMWTSPVMLGFLGLRFGLGFAHFFYDRLVWKFSDPRVRAVIWA